jgi:ParB-like chromosome segregation protein Spo0J
MAKKQEETANKYEKFTVEQIKRCEIHGADYNPRKITEEAKKKLKRSLKEHGLVMPIVVNRRTMAIVSGHQRVSLLDDIIRKDDYPLTVAMVDVDEKEEAVLNVSLNNQSLMGEWDTFALQDIHNLFPDIDFVSDFGFDESDIDIMLGDFLKDDAIEQPLIDPMNEAKKSAEDFRQMKKEQREKAKNKEEENPQDVHELSDLDYTLTVVFPNNREKADFMRKIRKDPKEKFVKSAVLFDISKGVYNLSALEK